MYLEVKASEDEYTLEVTIPDGMRPTLEESSFVHGIIDALGLSPVRATRSAPGEELRGKYRIMASSAGVTWGPEEGTRVGGEHVPQHHKGAKITAERFAAQMPLEPGDRVTIHRGGGGLIYSFEIVEA
jgi:hypothetical protein